MSWKEIIKQKEEFEEQKFAIMANKDSFET